MYDHSGRIAGDRGCGYLVRFANALTRPPGLLRMFFENSIKDTIFAHSNKDTICLLRPTMTNPSSPNAAASFARPPDATFQMTKEEMEDLRQFIPEKVKVEFQRLRLLALEHLTNLRAYEFSGTTRQAGLTTAEEPDGIENPFCWAEVHQKTLESLLQVVVDYYRRIYGTDGFAAIVEQARTDELPRIPDLGIDISHDASASDSVNSLRYITRKLDIRALEMWSVDDLVKEIYLEKKYHSSEHAFITSVPILCEMYRTPLFNTPPRNFYTLVVVSFDSHPARPQIPWESTDAIFQAKLPVALFGV